ncbi:hypothetical protein GRF29_8g1696626 [Pseudopithomyces chartarum]|uniref:Uncharacterized protein n=1 Tax=Pseudopithomyces chartarum TaxID=1892770 RepID=A0AAN6M554_9PLEO|nr:hypothetical protein GRF29_8g1696626 [Pseudopithomyces chartarum]
MLFCGTYIFSATHRLSRHIFPLNSSTPTGSTGIMIIRAILWACIFTLLQVQADQLDGELSYSYPTYGESTPSYGVGTSTTEVYRTSSITNSISVSHTSTHLGYTSSKTTGSVHSTHTSSEPVFVSTQPSRPSSSSGNKFTSSTEKKPQTTWYTSSVSSAQGTGGTTNPNGSLTSMSKELTSIGSGFTPSVSTVPSVAPPHSASASKPDTTNDDSSTGTKTPVSVTATSDQTTPIDSKTNTKSSSLGTAPSSTSPRTTVSSSFSSSESLVTNTAASSQVSSTDLGNSTLQQSTSRQPSGSPTSSSHEASTKSSSDSRSGSWTASSSLPFSTSPLTSSRSDSKTTSLTVSFSRGTSFGTTSSGTHKPPSTGTSSQGESSSSHGGSPSERTSSTSHSSIKASSNDGSSSHGSLSTVNSSASSTKGDFTSSVPVSSAQETSMGGHSSQSQSSDARTSSTGMSTTAIPVLTASVTTAPPTFTSTAVISSASPTSTSGSVIIDLLKKEIDDDVEDLKKLIVLVGVWIKSPKPNPPDVITLIDTIIPAMNTLKPKLPQPPKNDPECGTGNRGLRKRFWPFDGIKDVVNAVQAVTQVALKVSKIRTQLVKGVIDGVSSELLDVGKITDALDIYDPAKDPCAPQTTSKSSDSGAKTSSTTDSKHTKSSSSACSTRTVSNCNVVCTSTVTVGQGQTSGLGKACSTTCDRPTVTCGGASTSTSTTTSTVVSGEGCAKTCCGNRPSTSSVPQPPKPTSVNIHNRNMAKLPDPFGTEFNGVFNFMKDMCSHYSNVIDIVDDAAEKNTIGYQTPLDYEKYICMPGLHGCTAVVVMSRRYLWMAHIWEVDTIENEDQWDEDIFEAFEFGGHGSTIPEERSLPNLRKPGQPFGPGTFTQAFIITPRQRITHAGEPQPQELLYPDLNDELHEFFGRVLGGVAVETVPYVANAAKYWNYETTDPEDRPGSPELWFDPGPDYETPFGKVLFMFDPNKNDVPDNGCGTKAGYQLWVADNPAPVADMEWDFNDPLRPGQKRDGTSAPVCSFPSTLSTVVSPTSGVSRSSIDPTTRKSSAAASGSTSRTISPSLTQSRASSGFQSLTSFKTGSSTEQSSASSSTAISLSTTQSRASSNMKSTTSLITESSADQSSASSSTSFLTKSSSSPSTTQSVPSTAPTTSPHLTVPASGDGDCNGCGKWWKACENDWCPKVNLSGKDCSDKCFVHACFADSAPSECRPDGRCHSVTCPDSPKEPRKTIRDPSPIKVDCTDDTGCDCCFDFTAACFKNWIPEGTPKIRAYDFCYSEMCYDGPKKCLKGGNGCEFSKDCPKKKGEPKAGGWPGTPPNAIFNKDEIEDMVSYEYGLLSQNMTVAV